jgi:7-carboxy-7-deazaguanine synthase
VADRLKINEIYLSIQGESTWTGLPCVFIRLTGCHLRCTYCDSPHSFYEGGWMSVDDIMSRVAEFGVHLVEITGGEPLLQPACGPLAGRLLAANYTVLCETAGALPIDRLPDGVIRIMDLKGPSSGEVERNDWNNIAMLKPQDEVKFIVGHREDFDWAMNILTQHDLASRCTVLMSPLFGNIEPRTLVEWILEARAPVRFQIQLHKVVWEPTTLGV